MKLFRTLTIITLILAFCVIVFGAYVRLSDAGLGCPDWPGCYGKLIVPETEAHMHESFSDQADVRELDVSKAWKEMIHRYLASGLGFVILILAYLAWRNRDDPAQPVTLPFILVGLVIVQGLLGMLTVTLLLKPLVVTAHLLGGMTTLLLLFWLLLKTGKSRPNAILHAESKMLYPLAVFALIVVYCQIFLGGWTSTNYAALICPDFPTCQGRWWPAMDFAEGFTLWHGLGVDYEYGILKTAGRTAIHFTHRIGALITFITLISLVSLALSSQIAAVRRAAKVVLVVLLGQITLGITNVVEGLPLMVAVAHNGGAALLLLSVSYLLFRVAQSRAR